MNLLAIASRVKAGAKLLDKKLPGWRNVVKRHQDQFDFANGDYCVLGTLEHYSGKMRVLKARKGKDAQQPDNRFGNAATALGISGDAAVYGFDGGSVGDDTCLSYSEQLPILSDLWKAEIGLGQ
jgi:hypothetical protein